MALPLSEEENLLEQCCILSPWRCTVIHTISVLERPRSDLMIFWGDALNEALKAGCTTGRIHPLCFSKYLLYIHDFSHNKLPIYRAQVAFHLHFLLLNKPHGKKLYLLSHPLSKEGSQAVGDGKMLQKRCLLVTSLLLCFLAYLCP